MEFKGSYYEIEEPKFELLPEGQYTGFLMDIEEKNGSNENFPYVSIKWEIQNPDEYRGKILYDNFAINADKESKRLKAINNLTILVEAYTGTMNLNANNWQQMLNKKAELKVGIWKTPDGKTRNVIYNRIPATTHAHGNILLDQAKGLSPALPKDIDVLNDDIPF